MTKDPICGMEIDPNRSKFQSTHKGREYFFCSSYCRETFDKDPEKYTQQ